MAQPTRYQFTRILVRYHIRVLVFGVLALIAILRGTTIDRSARLSAKASKFPTRTLNQYGQWDSMNLFTISGRVTRSAASNAPDDRGIGGAVVAITEAAPSGQRRDLALTVLVQSDDDGKWTLDSLPTGLYEVSATANGFAPSSAAIHITPHGISPDPIVLTLASGGIAVVGKVVDAAGVGVAETQIVARTGHVSASFATTTDADGTYEIWLGDNNYEIQANNDNYAAAHQIVEVTQDLGSVDFTLYAGGRVHGRVLAGDTRKPVAGATVFAQPLVDGYPQDREIAIGRSDDRGTFAVARLPAGEYAVRVRGSGYASREATIIPIDMGGQLNGVELLAEPAFVIKGRVVSKTDSGRGVVGAMVYVDRMGMRLSAEEATDEFGTFDVVDLMPGTYVVSATLHGIISGDTSEVAITETDVLNVVLGLDVGVTVSGRIEPPTRATIRLISRSGTFGVDAAISSMRAESYNDGLFMLRGVSDGDYVIRVSTEDGRAGVLPITVDGRDLTSLIARVSSLASLSGRVIDTRGEPIEGETVRAHQLDARTSMMGRTIGNLPQAKSGPDGAFTITGLDVGHYSVYAERERAQDIEVLDESAISEITVVVDTRFGVIQGEVIDREGKPVVGAWVKAGLESNSRVNEIKSISDRVRTDAAGRFSFGRLREGIYTVMASAARGDTHGTQAGVKLGDFARLVLRQASRLVVSAYENGDLANCNISCVGVTAIGGNEAIQVHGSHVFEGLPAGEYECSIDSDFGFASSRIFVPAGGTASLSLDLAAWASVTGVAVSIFDGRPVEGLEFWIHGSRAISNDAGRFVIMRIPSGTGQLLVTLRSQETFGVERHTYSAKPGERVDLGTIKVLPRRGGEAGTLGFTTAIIDDTLVVASVTRGRAQTVPRIRLGDEIVSIDGHTVSDIGVDVAKRWLTPGNIEAGQSITLGIAPDVAVHIQADRWRRR